MAMDLIEELLPGYTLLGISRSVHQQLREESIE
jgi:hypothetical protein